jgi:hypothetical protein
MGKGRVVFGIYMNRLQVDKAVESLRIEGFRTADISALFPDNAGSKEGAVAGIGAGAAIGGALGLLAGIGALAVPGFGPFITAGPIMGALAGAAAIGTLGGVAGALVGLGMPEHEAKRYEGSIRNGGILLSVHCDDAEWTRRAKIVLETTGDHDIAATEEAGWGFAKNDYPKLHPC